MSTADGHGITIIYDGECPFCSSYVRMTKLRENVGRVDLVDARSDDSRVRDVQRMGYDLDQGMAAIYKGKTYHGADVVALLSLLGEHGSTVQKMWARMFADVSRARALYPLLRGGRRLALRVLGRSGIKPPNDKTNNA